MPRADGVSSQVHRPVTDCRQEAVPRLLVSSRSEMKVKTHTPASAVERTPGQAAGALPRGVWESAVGAGLQEAQEQAGLGQAPGSGWAISLNCSHRKSKRS